MPGGPNVSTGRKAELAKVSGNIHINVAAGAASALPITVPIQAATHEKANPKPIASASAASSESTPASGRKPNPIPTAVISTTARALFAVSASVPPASTAGWLMGRDRNRSTPRRTAASRTAETPFEAL
jgi:hypothetical protein